MSTDTRPLDLQLQRRSIFNVDDAAGVRIACRAGSVWITLDNDPRDIVLEAGESFTGTDHRRAMIYALDTASLALSDGQAAVAAAALQALPRRTRAFEQALT